MEHTVGFSPVPCIIDTDPGVDDVIALLLALASPELLVLAITLTHGNTPLDATLTNTRKMFWMLEKHLEENPEEIARWPGLDMDLRSSLGAGKILILMGSDGPAEGDAVFAKYFHGTDGLSNVDVRHPELTPPEMEDNDFYYVSDRALTVALPELMLDYPPSTIAYLALGPLTSLARLHALSEDHSFLHHFALILAMGGAVDVPGNTTPVAEFNTYADPWAAQTIISLSLPHFYLVPLDITTPHTLPFDLYTSLVDPHFFDTSAPSQANGKSPLVHFTSSFLEGTRETIRRFSTADVMEMHDPAVVWALIDWSRDGQSLDIRTINSRSSAMRRRIEEGGFTQSILERRRSSDLRLRARLEKERERLSSVTEVPAGVQAGESGYEDYEADEQSQFSGEGIEEGEEEYGWADDERLAPGWEWNRREFEVETTGTLTRGMLVVDRRASSIVPANSSSRPRPTNRAIAIEEAEAQAAALEHLTLDGTGTDAESEGEAQQPRGTKVVIATPGGDTLRTLLLERIWGVSIGLP
ncbi:hypothetical protein P7C70_g3948, partial [Phenoliferia sp. Uapishka_3]